MDGRWNCGSAARWFFQGRAALEKHFETEYTTVTESSTLTFTNYRFRFITRDVAFVDADLILNNVRGPDGQIQATLPIAVVFTALRREGAWFIQDERAHITAWPTTH
jgi:hypothetical protein